MSRFDSFFRAGARSRERGTSLGARDLIARSQRLIDTPRPTDGYPTAWHVEALHVGDMSVIGMAAVRAAETASERSGAS